jgi:hypothetical protein
MVPMTGRKAEACDPGDQADDRHGAGGQQVDVHVLRLGSVRSPENSLKS